MPQSSQSSKNENQITGLLQQLAWRAPLALIMAALAVAVSFYFLQARPLAEASTKAIQQDATERVITKVDGLVSQIERILTTTQDWSREGLASIDDPAGLNRLMIPVIQQRSIISSIHLATSEGREILLLKTPDGWKNRITDVPQKGKQTIRASVPGSLEPWQRRKTRSTGRPRMSSSPPKTPALPPPCIGRTRNPASSSSRPSMSC